MSEKPWARGEKACACSPEFELTDDELAAEDLTVSFIIDTMEYAEQHLHMETAQFQAEREELRAKETRRVRLADGFVRAMEAYLCDVNDLQQLSLIERQMEQTKNLPLCRRSNTTTKCTIGNLKQGLKGCVRRVTRQICRNSKSADREALPSLVRSLVYDRIWFDSVVSERQKMLKIYRINLLNSKEVVEDLTCMRVENGPCYV